MVFETLAAKLLTGDQLVEHDKHSPNFFDKKSQHLVIKESLKFKHT